MSSPNKPIAQEAYNRLAAAYAERVATKPHNANYERPATLTLLPEFQGKQVPDAGRGSMQNSPVSLASSAFGQSERDDFIHPYLGLYNLDHGALAANSQLVGKVIIVQAGAAHRQPASPVNGLQPDSKVRGMLSLNSLGHFVLSACHPRYDIQ